jgi:hypothetical protein
VRRKRVGPYEYYQLVERNLVDGKPRQRVLLHLRHYGTVETALGGWPKEVEGLRRYARQRRDKVEQITKDRSSPTSADATLKRAQKAESLVDNIAAKVKKLLELREPGKV